MDIHPEKPEQLRFVLAPSPTLASSTLLQVSSAQSRDSGYFKTSQVSGRLWQAGERRSHVEVCAEGGVLVQQLARRITEHGGAALVADYGHDGTKTDTFRVRRSLRIDGWRRTETPDPHVRRNSAGF